MTTTDHSPAAPLPLYLIATAATLGMLYAFRVVLVPFALAIVLAAALRPAVRRLRRWRLPAPAAAAVVVTATLLLIATLVAGLAVPARGWIAELPRTSAVLGRTFGGLRDRVDRISRRLMPPPPTPAPPAPVVAAVPDSMGMIPAPPPTVTRVVTPSALPSLSPYVGSVFGTTTQIIIGMVELSLLMFFMLAGGEGWDRSAAAAVGALTRGSSRPIDLLERIRGATSRYLAITFFINVGQGILVGLALWGLGVPAPFLWGLLTVLAEFIPYLGGLAMMLLLGLVGLAGREAWTVAILPPLAYLVITTIQNNIVSPLLYGKHLDLDPVAILMSVALWWFLWGVVGAFLAVPILATVQILCEESPRFHALGVYLKGGRPDGAPG